MTRTVTQICTLFLLLVLAVPAFAGKVLAKIEYFYSDDGTLIGNGYSYTAPNVGDRDSVAPSHPPNGIVPVADIHAHAAYDSGYNNDIFSPADMTGNDNLGITGYLTTPNGSLQKYDPTQPQGKRNSTISDQMPYDLKHPNPLKPKKQE